MSYKLAVVGSRVWTGRKGQVWRSSITNPEQYAFKKLDAYVAKHGMPNEIISGGAKGADTFAENWAKAKGFKKDNPGKNLKIFKPDGPESSKILMNEGYIPALFYRNKLIAKRAASDPKGKVYAFWDKKSKGTEDTLKFARDDLKMGSTRVHYNYVGD